MLHIRRDVRLGQGSLVATVGVFDVGNLALLAHAPSSVTDRKCYADERHTEPEGEFGGVDDCSVYVEGPHQDWRARGVRFMTCQLLCHARHCLVEPMHYSPIESRLVKSPIASKKTKIQLIPRTVLSS